MVLFVEFPEDASCIGLASDVVFGHEVVQAKLEFEVMLLVVL